MSATENVSIIKEQTLKSFGPDNAIEFNRYFEEEKLILQAMAELLCSSDMEAFANSEGLRWGLKLMFDLFGEKQERRVKDLYNEAINSPEYILKCAQNICASYAPGGCGSCRDVVLKSIQKLDLVIDTFGVKVYEQTVELREELLTIANAQKWKIAA